MEKGLPIEWQECTAVDLERSRLLECFRITRDIRPFYEEAGEGWNRNRKLREMSSTPHLQYILALNTDTDELTGFISFVLNDTDLHDEPTTFIYEFHVASTWRSKGLGSDLLKEVCRRAPGSVTLRAFAQNKRATEFYKRHNFVIDSTISTEFVLFMYHVKRRSALETDS